MGSCCSSVPAVPPPATGYLAKPEEVSKYEGDGPFYVTHKTDLSTVRYAERGVASEKETPKQTIPQLLKKASDASPDRPALKIEWPVPEIKGDGTGLESLPADQWKTWTFKEYYDDVQVVAKAMIKLGLNNLDGVTIYGFNSPFWMQSMMGCITAGGICAGIYPTDTHEQIEYKAKYADAHLAMVGGKKEFEVFKSIINGLPKLEAIVTWMYDEAESIGELKRSDGSAVKVLTWEQLMKVGKEAGEDVEKSYKKRLEEMKPENCAAFVFTSGTTGLPKAVMLSHDNVCFQGYAVDTTVPASICETEETQERGISYLPLSHVAGMVVDILFPLVLTASRKGYCTIYFARPYDLKQGGLGPRLHAVQPTLFLGVPRVWEKVSAKLRAGLDSATGIKKIVADKGRASGLKYVKNLELGGSGVKPPFHGFYDKKLYSAVKAKLGMTHLKLGISGAAPISKDVQDFFGSLGIIICDTYGMSECCGAACLSTNSRFVTGTCGSTLPGTEVKVFSVGENINDKKECPKTKDIFNPKEEEEGEICYRGRHIMMGYQTNPKLGQEHIDTIKKKNEEAIDSEGWLHSGDKGCMDERGMVRITGRFKELIIGKGGENIAPVPIEDNIKALAPGISNVIMIGDNQKYNIALVTLKAEGATGELPGSNVLDPEVIKFGDSKTISEAMKDKKWIAHIEDAIKLTNKNQKVCHNNAFKIQKFTILPYDFSIEGGELTPTLKLKRSFTDKKWKDTVQRVYDTDGTYIEYQMETVVPSEVAIKEAPETEPAA